MDPQQEIDQLHQLTFTSKTQGATHLDVVETLFQLGETYLAQQRLHWMMFHHPEQNMRQQAFQRLLQHTQEQNPSKLISVLATRFHLQQDQHSLHQLARQMQTNGDSSWHALSLVLDGNIPASPSGTTIAAHRVTRFAAAPVLYQTKSNRYSSHWLAREVAPLQLTVQGPTQLQLDLRPIITQDQEPMTVGFSVMVNGTLHYVPINNLQPSKQLGFATANTSRPGKMTRYQLDLGTGEHHIEVVPHFIDALVRVKTKPIGMAPHLAQEGLHKALTLGDHQTVIQWQPLNDAANLTRYTNSLLYLADTYPQTKQAVMVRSAQLVEQYPTMTCLQKPFQQLSDGSRWRSVKSVDDSAGIRPQYGEKVTPNMHARIRRALLPAAGHHEVLLARDQRHVFQLDVDRATTISLETSSHIPFPLVQEPAKVWWRLNKNRRQSRSLETNTSHQIKLKPGRHTLTVGSKDMATNHFLMARLQRNQAVHILKKDKRRNYYSATHRQPLRLTLHQPAWLRVEHLEGSDSQISYHYITQVPHELVLKPKAGKTTALYRIATRTFAPQSEQDKPELDILGETFPAAMPFAQVKPHLSQIEPFTNHNLFPNKATWELRLSSHDRNRVDDEDAVRAQSDAYQQTQVTWRHAHKNTSGHTRLRLLHRQRADGEPTLGLEAGYWQTDRFKNRWHARLNAFGQQQSLTEQNLNANALYARLGWSRQFEITPNWKHKSSVEYFTRHLNQNASNQWQGSPDLDVYSNYKRDHDRGVRIKEKVSWSPWEDTRFDLNLSLNSNANIKDLDNVHVDLGWDQMLGPIHLSLSTMGRQYFKDDHRHQDRFSGRHSLDLGWARQQGGSARWEAHVRLDYYNDGGSNVMFYVSRFFGGPGDYRHFAPHEVLFRGIKRNRNLSVGGE